MLRRATDADGPAIARLYRRPFGALAFLPTPHTPDDDLRHFAGVVRGDEVWLPEEDGAVLAFASLGDGRLEHLYVDPPYPARGGGGLLARAKRRRPGGLDLRTFRRNERARRFYEQHGFRPVEETVGSGDEEREPDVRYAWRP